MIRTLENYQQMVRMKQGEDGFDVPQIGEGSSFYPFFNYEIEYKTSDRFDFSRKKQLHLMVKFYILQIIYQNLRYLHHHQMR